jgi:predicted nucleic acid-binding Zn ribbon protein
MRSADPVKSVLAEVMGKARARHRALQQVQRGWARLVGAPLARHARPVSLRRGQLVVHVDGPGDHFALSCRKAHILGRLNTKTAGAVQELIIRVGDVPRATRCPT